ncbi:hypothetical protein Q9233_016147 [Columba guinea]|nr:hypothetical protein Q9233_016147 [Columba guinea]
MTFIGITVQKVNSSTTGSQKFPSGIGVGVFNVASVLLLEFAEAVWVYEHHDFSLILMWTNALDTGKTITRTEYV